MRDVSQPVAAGRMAVAIPGRSWLHAWFITLLAGPVFVMSAGFLVVGPLSFVAAFMALGYALPCSLALLGLTLPLYWRRGEVRYLHCALLGMALPIVETAFLYDIVQRGIDPWMSLAFACSVVLGLLSGIIFRHVLTHDPGERAGAVAVVAA